MLNRPESAEYQAIVAKYSPMAKIPGKTFLEIQQKLFIHQQMRKQKVSKERMEKEAEKAKFDRDGTEWSIDTQREVIKEVYESKNLVMSCLYQTSVSDLGELDGLELERLWTRLEVENHPIVDFFDLRAEKEEKAQEEVLPENSYQPKSSLTSPTLSQVERGELQDSTPILEPAKSGV